jgi:hypothetical protein
MMTTNWSDIPNGICLMRMFHERTSKHCLHVQLKTDDRPWYEQPHFPTILSQAATQTSHADFWDWAEKNLPIFDYQEPVKSCQ